MLAKVAHGSPRADENVRLEKTCSLNCRTPVLHEHEPRGFARRRRNALRHQKPPAIWRHVVAIYAWSIVAAELEDFRRCADLDRRIWAMF
jgi:hypothetical protein